MMISWPFINFMTSSLLNNYLEISSMFIFFSEPQYFHLSSLFCDEIIIGLKWNAHEFLVNRKLSCFFSHGVLDEFVIWGSNYLKKGLGIITCTWLYTVLLKCVYRFFIPASSCPICTIFFFYAKENISSRKEVRGQNRLRTKGIPWDNG